MTPTAIERTILETIIAACRAALGEDQATLKAFYDLGFRDGRGTADFFSVAGNPNRQAYIREVIGHAGKRTAWEGAFSPDGPWHRFNDAAAVPDA